MGSKVGWYITFLYNLAGNSLIVALPGIAVYIYRKYVATDYNEPSIYVPIFGCWVAIWSTYVLEK